MAHSYITSDTAYFETAIQCASSLVLEYKMTGLPPPTVRKLVDIALARLRVTNDRFADLVLEEALWLTRRTSEPDSDSDTDDE